ncbi:unnamed protein product [Rotaria socialis]|uniref:DOMON domain-containing protein n=1 Tax=Rotaria socialis TaxID=392032 RepID=A0A817K4W5_9BILA|nr:unnamed protein product [Rotaria socialis]CAF4399199.1 unnamed protein product [Rotaria socialis]
MLFIVLLLVAIGDVVSISSPITPFTTYRYSTELEKGIADLWWTVDNGAKDITFELHMKTTGWVALGISPGGGMEGADIGVGWVDTEGKVHFQDRHAFDFVKPVIDNTTENWLALRGRESNGWTAIQFRRLLDTCDPMDVEIKSGTNVIIYAYGLTDPVGDINYHQNRRGSRMIPLQSYANPPTENKFTGLDYFEFRLNNYAVPSNDTTYHCKVYKAPARYSRKRHAIAHKTMIDPNNVDLVHHLVLYECDQTVKFDDNNLPDGACDDYYREFSHCLSNTATVWAVGGEEIVEFPTEAGYPVGGDFGIKYYVIEMHYNNPKLIPNRRDNTGIRFYIGKELRQYDLGYLAFGTSSNALALTIPPKVDQFTVDSFCPSEFSKGDEFATRCVYNTMNKNEVTLGGQRTTDEMCSQIFTYYPRVKDLYGCFSMNHPDAWQAIRNRVSNNFNNTEMLDWIKNIEWTPTVAAQWQEFYNDASRMVIYSAVNNTKSEILAALPKYKDLPIKSCQTESI